jgi:hypothetical protein
MKITVQPAKRQGSSKVIVERELNSCDVVETVAGRAIDVLAADIYTPKASQRYRISFSNDELEMLLGREPHLDRAG